jgi:hypothetical protein
MVDVDLKERSGLRASAFFAAGCALIAAVLFVVTPDLITNYRAEQSFYESPAFFPRVALAIMSIAGTWHAVSSWLGVVAAPDSDEIDAGDSNRLVALLGVALFAVYVALTPVLGFGVATAAFVIVCSRIAGLSWQLGAKLALGIALILYGVFEIGLKVWFPKSMLLQLLSQ